MILLPLAGFLSGLLVGRAAGAYAITAALAAIGFTLVAAFTDEIDGVADLFVWGDTVVALLLTWVGIKTRRWLASRRAAASRT